MKWHSGQHHSQGDQGPIFRTFFPGKIPFFPQKMLGKNCNFRGKSFEKSFFQQIPRNFLRKITFRGKKCTKKLAPDVFLKKSPKV
jgi:hypothetical protein